MDNFPLEVQRVLALASGILSTVQITQLAERLMEMHGFSKPPPSALSISSIASVSPILDLKSELAKLIQDIASIQKQAVSSSSRSPPRSSTRRVQPTHPALLNIATACWYHTPLVDKAHRCISPCSFISQHSKRVSLKLSVIPPIAADCQCPNPGLFSQTVNTSPITTFETCSFSVDIGLQHPFPRVFVVADIPIVISGADFLAVFDLLVDCRQSRLHDKTTNFIVRDVSSSDVSRQLAVLDPESANPFRQLLLKYPSLTRPNFSSAIPPHDVVHHIRTTGPPLFSRPHCLVPVRLAAVKAEFQHMLQMAIIRQSESPCASPFHMVPKAVTGN
ncbi:hypothetical protein SprV_0501846100 [Sparganum proliferum]